MYMQGLNNKQNKLESHDLGSQGGERKERLRLRERFDKSNQELGYRYTIKS